MVRSLLDLMKNRRSIRKFKKENIPLEKIHKTLEVGRHAPSGANQQPWIYIVITDERLKEDIARAKQIQLEKALEKSENFNDLTRFTHLLFTTASGYKLFLDPSRYVYYVYSLRFNFD